MTWHAKALTTSYLSRPGAGATGQAEDESAFPFTTTSWYFLDALDMKAPAATRVVVAFGDSITDGTASTLNGDDRWPNALSRRLHAAYGNRVSVVNAGIGGNQVVGPAEYSAAHPFSGGPSARQRLERDVTGLSGVSAVIWLEGINDLGANAEVEAIQGGMKEVVGGIRSAIQSAGDRRHDGFRVGNAKGSHGTKPKNAAQALNGFIARRTL
jgi:lysophospholipase L1-like esterase